jgi:hypothetical protein
MEVKKKRTNLGFIPVLVLEQLLHLMPVRSRIRTRTMIYEAFDDECPAEIVGGAVRL